MPLEEYIGLAPRDAAPSVTVSRVAHHRYWTDESDVTDCQHCEEDVVLRDRHLVVALSDDGNHERERRYLCSERCLAEWLDAE